VKGEGCLVGMKLKFTVGGGQCPLDLAFTAQGASWKLGSATLRSDPECGNGWGSGKTYATAPGASASVMGLPATVASPSAASACTQLQSLTLNGTLSMTNGGTTIQLGLSGLSVTGWLPSTGGSGSCGDAPNECGSLECGSDAWGNVCGTCGAGMMCADGLCVETSCIAPPGGTGTGKGKQIKDFSLKEAGGGSFSLHSVCGESKAIFMVKTAEW